MCTELYSTLLWRRRESPKLSKRVSEPKVRVFRLRRWESELRGRLFKARDSLNQKRESLNQGWESLNSERRSPQQKGKSLSQGIEIQIKKENLQTERENLWTEVEDLWAKKYSLQAKRENLQDEEERVPTERESLFLFQNISHNFLQGRFPCILHIYSTSFSVASHINDTISNYEWWHSSLF